MHELALCNTAMKTEDILDNPNTTKKKINFKSYLLLLVASLVALKSAIVIWTKPGNYSLNDNMLYGLILLAIIWLSVFFVKNIWKYLFLVFLGLYFINYVNISDTHYTFFFGPIQISYIPLAYTIAFLLLNKDMLVKLKLKPQEIKNQEEKLKRQFEAKVEEFMIKWETKSKKELEEIIEQNVHLEEAIEAAKRLVSKNVE